MARTYEELLAAQTELAHFNPNHDPRNGQFAKRIGGGLTSAKNKIKGIASNAKEASSKERRIARSEYEKNKAASDKGLSKEDNDLDIEVTGILSSGKAAISSVLSDLGAKKVSAYINESIDKERSNMQKRVEAKRNKNAAR